MSYTPPIVMQTQATLLAADASTTSTSFSDLITKTVTTSAANLVISASMAWNALIAAGAFRLTVDGSPYGGVQAVVGAGSGSIDQRIAVSAGSHTVALQYRTSTLGTLRVRPQTQPDLEHASLIVVESRG